MPSTSVDFVSPSNPPAWLTAYLSYEAMCAEADRIAALFPSDCAVERAVLGHSPEGRELFALHVWPRGRGQHQPTLWIDTGMHSAELVGTNVVLAQLESLALALQKGDPIYRAQNFIFVPRISPDGAECYFTNGLVNRSNPRDARAPDALGPHWRRACLQEKHTRPEHRIALLQSPKRVGVMRRQNPAGVWTCDDEHPSLLRRRGFPDLDKDPNHGIRVIFPRAGAFQVQDTR